MSELRVALTFDAEHPSRRQCPPEAADEILAELAARGIVATFFLQGRWATAYPDRARAIAQAGHLVGNHSNAHAPMPDLSDTGMRADVSAAEGSIRRILGLDPRPWFRCPFGAGRDNPRVQATLAALGYRNIHWDVAADDWEDEQTPSAIERAVVDGALAHGDTAIVLLHTWPGPTAAALPGIVTGLRSRGAQFITVDAIVDAT